MVQFLKFEGYRRCKLVRISFKMSDIVEEFIGKDVQQAHIYDNHMIIFYLSLEMTHGVFSCVWNGKGNAHSILFPLKPWWHSCATGHLPQYLIWWTCNDTPTGLFSKMWSNMIIETTFMRYGHVPGGLAAILLDFKQRVCQMTGFRVTHILSSLLGDQIVLQLLLDAKRKIVPALPQIMAITIEYWDVDPPIASWWASRRVAVYRVSKQAQMRSMLTRFWNKDSSKLCFNALKRM